MGQYKTGYISIEYGSTTVYGQSTKWTSSIVQENFIFTVKGEINLYNIDRFISPMELELKQPYLNKSGTNLYRKEYSIVQDYTTNLNLPQVKNKDINWVGIYTKALRLTDRGLYRLGHFGNSGCKYITLEPIEAGVETLVSGGSYYTPSTTIVPKVGKLIYDDSFEALLLCTGESVSATNVSGDTVWYTQWQRVQFNT